MRTRILPFIVACAIIFTSCKKQGVDPNTILGPPNVAVKPMAMSALAGKWPVSKIEAYTLDMAGNASNKITYKQPLSDSNYVSFSKDSICQWNADHYYIPGEKGNGVVHHNNFRKLSFHYSISGQSIDFWQPQGPNGPNAVEYENATILSPKSIVIHATYTTDNGKWMVSDTYFSRE